MLVNWLEQSYQDIILEAFITTLETLYFVLLWTKKTFFFISHFHTVQMSENLTLIKKKLWHAKTDVHFLRSCVLSYHK